MTTFQIKGECDIFHSKAVLSFLVSMCILLVHFAGFISLSNNQSKQLYETDAQKIAKKVLEQKKRTTKGNSTITPIVAKTTPEPHQSTVYKVTAYCPCKQCCGKTDGITATGTKALAGRTIAVDPSVIPLGSKVNVGGKTYVAEDTGGAIKGRRIDMFFNSHKEAEQFGVQNLPVVVVGRT